MCVPIVSAEVLTVTLPLDNASLPMVFEPSLNVTLPVGVPLAGAVTVTVACKFTDCPGLLGFGLAEALTLVPPWLTVCVRPDDVETAKLELPL